MTLSSVLVTSQDPKDARGNSSHSSGQSIMAGWWNQLAGTGKAYHATKTASVIGGRKVPTISTSWTGNLHITPFIEMCLGLRGDHGQMVRARWPCLFIMFWPAIILIFRHTSLLFHHPKHHILQVALRNRLTIRSPRVARSKGTPGRRDQRKRLVDGMPRRPGVPGGGGTLQHLRYTPRLCPKRARPGARSGGRLKGGVLPEQRRNRSRFGQRRDNGGPVAEEGWCASRDHGPE